MGRPFKNEEDQEASLRERYPWAHFHAGKWTKEGPKRAGLYFVATRDGTVVGTRRYVEHKGEVRPAYSGFDYHKGWDGWFWSEPLPNPAKPVPLWDPTTLPKPPC